MDLNGNGITVSNEVWDDDEAEHPEPAPTASPCIRSRPSALKPVIDKFKAEGKPFKMGMVFPVSTHNYELRYWLASGGINPGYYSPDRRQRADQGRRAALGDAAAADAGDAARPARSTATASASRGTSRRCSRASACR